VLHFKAQGVPVLYTYFIPHAYPTPAMYKDGVEADLFMAVRTDPNIKRMLPEMRQRISEFVRAENLYDALLVDEEDNLTEGSKTNVFFVQGENIITAPGHQVLKGITRQKVIQLCNQLNYIVIERPIPIIHLQLYHGAFFTGTSPKVLPIRRIANIEYKLPHPVIKAIMEAYDSLMAASVSRNKSSLK
jgi:branched-chain amino acid aminotransferase